MIDGINAPQFVAELPARARGRACIVLTHEYKGQKKWAKELARQTNSSHIDLLDLFAGSTLLSGQLRDFSVVKLFELLSTFTEKEVLIVSGIEFLKATWSGQPTATEEFTSRIETWQTKPALLFVMQYDKALAERSFSRFKQYTFVIDIRETIKL